MFQTVEKVERLRHVGDIHSHAHRVRSLTERPTLGACTQACPDELVHCFTQADVAFVSQPLHRRGDILIETHRCPHLTSVSSKMRVIKHHDALPTYTN
jgi:hypothetical protein